MDKDKFREAIIVAGNVEDKKIREIALNGLLDMRDSDDKLQKIFARALGRKEKNGNS